jgi:hypothetical protein
MYMKRERVERERERETMRCVLGSLRGEVVAWEKRRI